MKKLFVSIIVIAGLFSMCNAYAACGPITQWEATCCHENIRTTFVDGEKCFEEPSSEINNNECNIYGAYYLHRIWPDCPKMTLGSYVESQQSNIPSNVAKMDTATANESKELILTNITTALNAQNIIKFTVSPNHEADCRYGLIADLTRNTVAFGELNSFCSTEKKILSPGNIKITNICEIPYDGAPVLHISCNDNNGKSKYVKINLQSLTVKKEIVELPKTEELVAGAATEVKPEIQDTANIKLLEQQIEILKQMIQLLIGRLQAVK